LGGTRNVIGWTKCFFNVKIKCFGDIKVFKEVREIRKLGY
jgi:hypothetical protein